MNWITDKYASKTPQPNELRPSIDASYQVSVHLAQWFQRRRFKKNRPIINKNCLWQPCLLMDRDEISNLYRGPSIDAEEPSGSNYHCQKMFLVFIGNFFFRLETHGFKEFWKLFLKMIVCITMCNIIYYCHHLMVVCITFYLCSETTRQMLPTKFQFIWPSGFRGEDLKKIGQS
jgi:hypothetical protein